MSPVIDAEPTPTPTPASPSPTPTPPSTREPVVVAVKGDWGAGTGAQRGITRRMCAMRAEEGFADVLTTGDNFYDTGIATRTNYRDPEQCLYAFPGHRWRATWGNHDQHDDTAEVLGAERYYRWSLPGVDFFALDSNQPSDPRQRRWLVEQLAASTASVKVAYFHHPPFTSGSVHRGNGAVRNGWVPLFERHGVDLVLAGHNHVYEHIEVEGIHYVTTGGGGAVLYRCERGEPRLITCMVEHHFLLVSFEVDRIEVRAIDRDGDVLDRFRIPL